MGKEQDGLSHKLKATLLAGWQTMKLHKLKIQGFRRIQEAEVVFGDATFLIGSNNAGKSSVFAAINYLLKTVKNSVSDDDFHQCVDDDGNQCPLTETIVLEAEFRDVPRDANGWRGFRGRLLTYEVPPGSNESGLMVVYRKTFRQGSSDPTIEVLSCQRSLAPGFDSKNVEDLISAGMPNDVAMELFGKDSGKITPKQFERLEECNEAWITNNDQRLWVVNPGGFSSVFASKLPIFVSIPLDDGRSEIMDKSGALETIMKELFNDVRSGSDNYKKAEKYLHDLSLELDPSDTDTQFGKLMNDLNNVLGSVFEQAQFYANADLSKAEDVIKPNFQYTMSSNVRTPIRFQGSGMIRSAVFALLKFRQQWFSERKKDPERGMIIGFEEPEIYLHPNAANQMRDTIYDLTKGDIQIVCTTHSPFMVDLNKKERQVLNSMRHDGTGIHCNPFSITEKFLELQGDDKQYIKMLLRMDDYASRIFFAEYVVIVEGDTEDIVFRETIRRMPERIRKKINSEVQIFKARGKPVIISLVKYLHAFGIYPFVVHDADTGTAGAECFNEKILEAVGDPARVLRLNRCIEEELGYQVPSSDKPFRAYEHVSEWGEEWDDVPENWREKMSEVFSKYFN